MSFIIVTDEDDPQKALQGDGDRYFVGSRAFGEFFTADQSSDDFGSKTFIHFYDDANGTLLQTVEYHTSCSQPVTLGDVIGNATLTGYDGEDGSASLPPVVDPPEIDLGGVMLTTDMPFNPSNIGVDADSPTGPLAQLGDKVTWTYVVTNPGNVPLTVVNVFDDSGTPETDKWPGQGNDDFKPVPVLKDGFNFGDENKDDLLDPGEVWYYQAMEIATESGQYKNTARVVGKDNTGQRVIDMDMSHYIVNPLVFEKYVSVPTPPSNVDQCDINGKPVSLSFEYIPGTLIMTGQASDKATATGTPDDDGESYIVVGDGDLFAGVVQEGSVFTIGGSFGSNTVFEIYDDLAAFNAGASPLQTLEYHTSCSQPIQLGDMIGSVILVGYQGEDGSDSRETGLGDPADSPTGPTVLLGDEVVFNYEVTNAGNVGLVNVSVTDSVLGNITEIVGKSINDDDVLDPGETWVYTASTIAEEAGQQFNLGTITANSMQAPGGTILSANDPAFHFVETIKFFVVNADDDSTFTYTESGGAVGNSLLAEENKDPRGLGTDADGEKIWVVDKNREVFVYDAEGDFETSWVANGIGKDAEGIAVHPDPSNNRIWIVTKEKKRVFRFNSGKSKDGGSLSPNSSFALRSDNDHPKGLTTDGTFLWVVDDDGGTEKVFKYKYNGQFLGSWEIGDSSLEEPRGITVDPNGGETIWIVDKKSGKVYQFDNATGVTSGTLNSSGMFPLAAGNEKPEGLADPFIGTLPPANPLHREDNALDIDGNGVVTPLDALLIINALNQHSDLPSDDPALVFEMIGMPVDSSGDGAVSALDALLVINALNQRVGAAEGEFSSISDELDSRLDSTDDFFAEYGGLDYEDLRKKRR